jgi:death-on-curing protein
VSRRDVVWVLKFVALRIHDEQLRRHGGDGGMLDEGRLDAALARPRQRLDYDPGARLEDLAAALAVSIAMGHPFIDGNKRTAAVVSLMFLQLNQIEIRTSETELASVFIAVADGAMPESDLASWFAENAVPQE